MITIQPRIIQAYIDTADRYSSMKPTADLLALRTRIRNIKNFIREQNCADFTQVPKEAYLTLIPSLSYGRGKGHTLAIGRYLYTNKDKTVLVISPHRGLYYGSSNLIVTSVTQAIPLLRGNYTIDKIIFDSVTAKDAQKVIEASHPSYLPLMVRVGA